MNADFPDLNPRNPRNLRTKQRDARPTFFESCKILLILSSGFIIFIAAKEHKDRKKPFIFVFIAFFCGYSFI